MTNTARAQLSKEIKSLLGKSAPIEFQDAMVQDLMARGESTGKTNAQVIADRVIEQARNGDRWAIEFIAERSEGKAAQATVDDNSARLVEEALNDVTVKHLNELAGVGVSERANPVLGAEDRGRDGDAPDPRDRIAPPTPGLLDLPEDGDSGPEEPE